MKAIILLFCIILSSSALRTSHIRRELLKHRYSSTGFPRLNTDLLKRKESAILFQYRYEDEKPISPKAIITAAVLFLGVFGLGFLSPISSLMKDLKGGQQSTVNSELKKTAGEEKRGTLTKLTRREINGKLAKVPIFFATKGENVVYTSNGEGLFFTDNTDAENYAKSNDLKVSATSMDDIYYTLINKKTKLGGSYITGVAGSADPTAIYKLVSSEKQFSNTPNDWQSSHSKNDVPLFRIPGLAFSKDEGLEIPLFLQKQDAITSFNRLQDSKKSVNPNVDVANENSIDFQIVSLDELLGRWSTGGFEGRTLEIYPSMEAITAAASIMTLP